MAKSKRNFVTINGFLERFPGAVLRLIVLQHHYRKPVDYSDALAHQARAALHNLEELLARLALVGTKGSVREELRGAARSTERDFITALEDDFATPQALAALFEFAGLLERSFPSLVRAEARLGSALLARLFGTLGLALEAPRVPQAIRALAAKREAKRRARDFGAADALRKKLESLGYRVDDTPHGPLITPWPPRRTP